MSLTMSPLVSLDSQMPECSQDMEGLCGRWILKHKPHVNTVAAGTTFPPFSHHLPYFRQRAARHNLMDPKSSSSKCKCLSEPDMNSEYQNASLEDDLNDDNDNDEDYLFEFDIGSPASSDEENNCDYDQDSIMNIVEPDEVDKEKRRYSVSSDNSSSSRRKESGVVVDGFSSIFGSTSSGVGSERRSLHNSEYDDDTLGLEGLSVNPLEWKENSALYLGGGGGLSSSRSTEGSATPILAVSPGPCQNSPLVSPDSVISDDIMMEDPGVCGQCGQDVASSSHPQEDGLDHASNDLDEENNFREESANKNLEKDMKVETELNSQPKSDEILKKINEKLSTPPTPKAIEKVQINPSLVVSTEKLCNLLHKLESDRVYSSHDNEELEAEDLMMSPLELSRQESFTERPKLRKCSSLKTSKTPPTTPGQRKIVRFADILGLDLSEVKHFADEIPKVPKAAYADLDVSLSDIEVGSPVVPRVMFPTPPQPQPLPVQTTSLVPMFNQPGGSSNFLETVSKQKVCLENAFMDGPHTVYGIVRVLNISFHKSVTVRWTTDEWRTVRESDGEYVVGSSAGNMDKFSFKLTTNELEVGNRLQFCLRYECNGEFWDSNNGANYVFQVFNNSSSTISSSLTISRTIPAPVPISNRSVVSRNFRASAASAYSPSQHGDDPWLRFM